MDILLNNEGYIDFTTGDLLVIRNRETMVAQRLTVRLRTYAQEWFLDQAMGIAWFTDVLLKNVPRETVDRIIQEELSKDKFVDRIVRYSSTINTKRVYECVFEVAIVGIENLITMKYLANENGVFLTDQKGNLIQLEG